SCLALLFLCTPVVQVQAVMVSEDSEDNNFKVILAQQNNFALKFCSEITKAEISERSFENIFVSPFSLTMALDLVLNATAGKTKNELLRVMNIPGKSLKKINDTNKRLIENLSTWNIIEDANPKTMFTLEIANGFWLNAGFTILPEYKNLVEKYYYAQFSVLDFLDEQAANQINDWVSIKTHDKITKLISAEDLQGMVMLLANATYFKGQWEMPFSLSLTDNNQRFHSWSGNLEGEVISMMKKDHQGALPYWEDKKVQVVEMPYSDSTVSAYVILPRKEGHRAYMDEGERIWTSEFWRKLDNEMVAREGILSLPKFKFEYNKTLNDDLMRLGITSIFGDDADFSNLTSGKVQLSTVLQKTFVSVDEYGTEAAAVSGGVFTTSVSDEIPFEMFVNRPFYFIIREKNSGSFLFAGAITKP
ncbi:MAG: serpin family protein, partial [Oligoflexia bacterium]|nr:serpin family protein [Oligoflexia bacterium]